MRNINIKFLFFDDKTCKRCKTTEDSFYEAVKVFKNKHKDFEVKIERRKLTREEIEKSPTILLDDTDLESYLFPDFEPQSNTCEDCSCLVGQSVSCRTYGDGENLSKEEILEALEKHLRIVVKQR